MVAVMTKPLLKTAASGRAPLNTAEWRHGFRDMTPLAIAYLPFALVLGAAVAHSPDPMASWAATLPLYGGSAHLALLASLSAGSAAATAASVALLINLRLVAYSTSLTPLFAGSRRWVRLLGAAVVVDPTWMIAQRRGERAGTVAQRRAHYFGAAAALTVAWLAAVTAGALLGAVGPAAGALAIAVPLCMLSIVVPHLRVPGGFRAIAAAVLVVVATTQIGDGLPAGTEILLAMVAAGVAGWTPANRLGRRLGERPVVAS